MAEAVGVRGLGVKGLGVEGLSFTVWVRFRV